MLARPHGLAAAVGWPLARRWLWPPRAPRVRGGAASCMAPGWESPVTMAPGIAIGEASAVPAIVATAGIVTPSTVASATDTHDVRTADRTICTMTGASAPPSVTLRGVPPLWSGMPERTTLDRHRATTIAAPNPIQGGRSGHDRHDARDRRDPGRARQGDPRRRRIHRHDQEAVRLDRRGEHRGDATRLPADAVHDARPRRAHQRRDPVR